MKPKLLIINNGLKNLRGHYFETSISIAEAAHRLGYRPILATHATCEPAIIPEWIEFYPIFCTDHWMQKPPPAAPDLHAIRGDLAALQKVNIEAVLRNEANVSDYLLSRFEEITFPELLLPEPAQTSTTGRVRAALRRLKRLLRIFVPPVLLPGVRQLYHQGRAVPAGMRGVLRKGMPPVLFELLRGAYRQLKGTARAGPELATADELRGWSEEEVDALEEVLGDPLECALEKIDSEREFDYTLAFQRDLERLLCLTGAARHDHVFLPTAHGRELTAVQRLVQTVGESNTPLFHLEFRHALDMSGCFDDPDFVHPYTIQHRLFFDHARRQAPSLRIRLYTDTLELTEEYEHFSGLDFSVLPIPFRANLIRPSARKTTGSLCIAYFGDARDEKGFFHLPAVVTGLFEEYVKRGKVRFLIQASMCHPEWNARSAAALDLLREYPPEQVQLVGLEEPLSPDDYYSLVSEADLLLCPYSLHAYKRRSSGTLTEAIAAGIPTVVPADTWLARQQPPGTGEQFRDEPSLVAAVRTICDNYAVYGSQAQRTKDEWLAFHSPEELVKQLTISAGEGTAIMTRCPAA